MTISAIVATDENGLIGKFNTLPWHLPADLKYFKQMTTGKTIIMGSNTYISLGKPLPNRKNIVISRNKVDDERIETYSNLEDAISNHPDSFIIGGAQLYKYAIENNLIDVLYLTVIHHDFGKGDAYFQYEKSNWSVNSEIFNKSDELNKYDYTYLELKKQKRL